MLCYTKRAPSPSTTEPSNVADAHNTIYDAEMRPALSPEASCAQMRELLHTMHARMVECTTHCEDNHSQIGLLKIEAEHLIYDAEKVHHASNAPTPTLLW
jgi:hypothetical protein